MRHKRLILVALGAGAVGFLVLKRRAADKGGSMSVANYQPATEDSLGVVEVESEDIDDDGNLVVDDLIVAVDDDGTIVATDETIAVITPEGDTVIDERLSVIGTDGKLHTIGEDIAVTEADDE